MQDGWRLVVYHSLQHTGDYAARVLRDALGLASSAEVEPWIHRLHFEGRAVIAMPTFAAAEQAFDRIVAAGPDPEHPASDGSLAAAVELVLGVQLTVVRRGRVTAAGFQPMDLAALEAFMGCSLDDYDVWPRGEPSAPPVLVVRGRPTAWWRSTWVVVLVLWPALLVVGGAVLALGLLPLGRPGPFGAVLTLAAFTLPVVVLVALIPRREGRARLWHDRIIVDGKSSSFATTVRWEELAAFRDASDHVQLLRRGERVGAPALTIPTPDEAERAALLAALLARGVPRQET
jgi:hypothetical protein